MAISTELVGNVVVNFYHEISESLALKSSDTFPPTETSSQYKDQQFFMEFKSDSTVTEDSRHGYFMKQALLMV